MVCHSTKNLFSISIKLTGPKLWEQLQKTEAAKRAKLAISIRIYSLAAPDGQQTEVDKVASDSRNSWMPKSFPR